MDSMTLFAQALPAVPESTGLVLFGVLLTGLALAARWRARRRERQRN